MIKKLISTQGNDYFSHQRLHLTAINNKNKQMKTTSIIFALVIVLPLILVMYSILAKDKQKSKLGMLVVGITFIVAIVISYYVNRNK